jgi:hypothetical protein
MLYYSMSQTRAILTKGGNMEKTTLFADRINNKELTPLAPSFIDFIYKTAEYNNLSADEVWAMWKEYCNQCACADQSPTKYEFCEWNKLETSIDTFMAI